MRTCSKSNAFMIYMYIFKIYVFVHLLPLQNSPIKKQSTIYTCDFDIVFINVFIFSFIDQNLLNNITEC